MDPAPQEGALTAMASVADCAKAHFERYYDSVMPLLRHLLSSASARTHQLLRAKALECISLVGMAVGRDRFRADAHEVMSFMQALQVRPCALPRALAAAVTLPRLWYCTVDTPLALTGHQPLALVMKSVYIYIYLTICICRM